MLETGFYRLEPDNTILFGGTTIFFPDGTFICEQNRDQYESPYWGWEWFDTKEEAYAAHGLTVPEEESPVP